MRVSKISFRLIPIHLTNNYIKSNDNLNKFNNTINYIFITPLSHFASVALPINHMIDPCFKIYISKLILLGQQNKNVIFNIR